MNVADINDLSRSEFVDALGWIFEQSPWVADRAWFRQPFRTRAALHEAMVDEVSRASPAEQLALLRAHPDLGTRLEMSEASQGEQSGAGLDRLTPVDRGKLLRLNREYREKFGYPFLYAVKGSSPEDILRTLEERLERSAEQEYAEALRQVYRIAWIRLEA
jgi:2-oxo-4-hydroxy-4-carboxy-5-ureidoimidazoline decarboxylase